MVQDGVVSDIDYSGGRRGTAAQKQLTIRALCGRTTERVRDESENQRASVVRVCACVKGGVRGCKRYIEGV